MDDLSKEEITKGASVKGKLFFYDKKDNCFTAIFTQKHIVMYSGVQVQKILIDMVDDSDILITMMDACTCLEEKKIGSNSKIQKQ